MNPYLLEITYDCILKTNIDNWIFNNINTDDISIRAILCLRNIDVNEINERVLDKVTGY